MLNRTAINVKAKMPFLKWLESLPDPFIPENGLDDINYETHIYLVDEVLGEDDHEALIVKHFPRILVDELAGWWTDENDYPAIKTADEFLYWFDVSFHSIIMDLLDEPLIDEL